VSIELVSIGSSSSGNSYLIKANGTNILLDLGLSATKIVKAIDQCGLAPEDIDAVLITHEHIDHVRSVRTIAKKCPNASFYASRGTMAGCDGFVHVADERCVCVGRRDSMQIGEAEIRCFGLSHDANEPIGYSLSLGDEQLTVVTDTGIITEEIFEEMCGADMLVFEANHEEELLMFGPYPYNVKMRIKSDVGHLSNVTSGQVLARMLSEHKKPGTVPTIMLAHLSDKNNTPYQARMTIEDILRENGYKRDEHYYITIAAKEGLSTIGE